MGEKWGMGRGRAGEDGRGPISSKHYMPCSKKSLRGQTQNKSRDPLHYSLDRNDESWVTAAKSLS